MNEISRRKLITGAVASAGGVVGITLAGKIARAKGLIPPDAGVLYGAGETLTYGVHRILTRNSMAREFSPDQISKPPFANEAGPLGEAFERRKTAGISEWRIDVDGMVAKPSSFSVAELRTLPARSQITHLACEEGWSYIAQWTGVPLAQVLALVGTPREARYVVYRSIQPDWWDSIDMADALHPQTLIALAMNGADLPVVFGGPARMRVPRQLGYKSVKYLTRITVTDDLKRFGKGLGSAAPEGGYAWYAGI
jgi:DMSO/TMAO reductase YedYZ molybdopterin-dependent catalytic subunit